MNRFQHEVAAMDRRHYILMRVASFGTAAILAAAALWAAGVSPSDWLRWVAQHFANELSATAAQSHRDNPAASAAPASVLSPPTTQSTQGLAGTDASISPVPLRLHAIRASPGRSPTEGTAQLGTSIDNPQTYVAGAILANGARLTEIHSDHVVLQRDGRKLVLYVSAQGNVANDKGATDLAVVGGPPQHASPPPGLPRDRLTEVVRAMAFYEDDLLSGLQIFPGRRSGTFAQLGLQPGDVITALDGVPVINQHTATEALRALLDGAAITANIRRGRDTKTIVIDGAVVVAAVAEPQSPTPSQAMAHPAGT